jgi:hypothetical protein
VAENAFHIQRKRESGGRKTFIWEVISKTFATYIKFVHRNVCVLPLGVFFKNMEQKLNFNIYFMDIYLLKGSFLKNCRLFF